MIGLVTVVLAVGSHVLVERPVRMRTLTRTNRGQLLSVLGGWWRLLRVIGVLPERVRDWAYDGLAANRYRWFGKADYCALLTPEQRARLIG